MREQRKRSALERQVTTEVATMCIHRSLDVDFSVEISGVCTKKTKEFAELINRCGNVSAEIRSQPF